MRAKQSNVKNGRDQNIYGTQGTVRVTQNATKRNSV